MLCNSLEHEHLTVALSLISCMSVVQEALWRAAAFTDAGADVLFIDALESWDEMQAFCSAGGGAASLPKVIELPRMQLAFLSQYLKGGLSDADQ